MIKNALLSIFVLLLFSCNIKESVYDVVGKDTLITRQGPDSIFIPHYNLDKANHKNTIPKVLKEISGLSYFQDHIYTINDEEGNTFVLAPSSGDIINSFRFGGKGDYEGIQVMNDRIYTITSSGQLLVQGIKNKKVKEYKLHFDAENDIEGLGKIRNQEKLIIALKGKPSYQLIKDRSKEVYTLEFEKRKPMLRYLWSISPKKLASWVKKNYKKKKEKDLIKRVEHFSPSGIACHPIDSKIYILSSGGKLLVVLDYSGNVVHIHFLDDKLFKQPEGICFDDQCNLYIADEGQKKSAKIYQFRPRHSFNLK